MFPGLRGILDLQAQMHVARVCGDLGVGRAALDLIVEQLDDHAAGQIDEGSLDRHIGIACDAAEIRAVEHRLPARRLFQETLPEGQRGITVGHTYADVVQGLHG